MDKAQANRLWDIIEQCYHDSKTGRDVDSGPTNEALRVILDNYHRNAAPVPPPARANAAFSEAWRAIQQEVNGLNIDYEEGLRDLEGFADAPYDDHFWRYMREYCTMGGPTLMLSHFFELLFHHRIDAPDDIMENILLHLIRIGADVNFLLRWTVEAFTTFIEYAFWQNSNYINTFAKILLENGANQKQTPWFIEFISVIIGTRGDYDERIFELDVQLREDFYPNINLENQENIYVSLPFITPLMKCARVNTVTFMNRSPDINTYRRMATTFCKLLRAGAHPFFNDYKNGKPTYTKEKKHLKDMLPEDVPGEEPRNTYRAQIRYFYGKYAKAWRKFNEWKQIQKLSFLPSVKERVFSGDYTQPRLHNDVREQVRTFLTNDDVTSKDNIQQMRHYLWATDHEFALSEFAERHFLGNLRLVRQMGHDYFVHTDPFGNIKRALTELIRIHNAEERLACYNVLRGYVNGAGATLSFFALPELDNITQAELRMIEFCYFHRSSLDQ